MLTACGYCNGQRSMFCRRCFPLRVDVGRTVDPPTHQEIQERCAVVQESWSEDIRYARASPAIRPARWDVPVVAHSAVVPGLTD